jgi:hypothetical protein
MKIIATKNGFELLKSDCKGFYLRDVTGFNPPINIDAEGCVRGASFNKHSEATRTAIEWAKTIILTGLRPRNRSHD